MMIMPELKLAFVHIYKTGGTSLTQLLAPHTSERYRSEDPRYTGEGFQGTWHYKGDQHAMFSNSKSGFPAELLEHKDDWRFIAVVRNPYTWSFSVFREFFATDRGFTNGQNFLFGQVKPGRSLQGFYDFCRSFKPGHPTMFGLATQSEFLNGIPDSQLHLIRFENYEEDVRTVLPRFGIEVEHLPHALDRGNQKRRRAEELMSDPQHLEFCNEYYADDFNRFGYEMIEQDRAV